jgi:MoxR-like ATPase
MSSDAPLSAQADSVMIGLEKAKTAISARFIGQPDVVDLALGALLSGGHALLVGVPGLGKTRLVETLGAVMGLATNRVQFTPDLMPADILGSEVLETGSEGSRQFKFIQGPIFCQLLMADEINRASPRTQSALLQAMQEKQVSIAGQTRVLSPPFHVLATQNPIEQEGTYPLPEAQLDRFLVQIQIGYPDRATEEDILIATTGVHEGEAVQVFDTDMLIDAQTLIRRMPVGESVVTFILELVRALRPEDETSSDQVCSAVAWGPGTRAAQALMLMCRANALLAGRLSPSISDVLEVSAPVLTHRMSLRFSAEAQGVSLEQIISETAKGIDDRGVAA